MPSSNITPTDHGDDTASIDSMQLTADIESGDVMATTMSTMTSRATTEHSPSRDEIPAKTSPIGYEGVWPINASLNAGTVATNGESPDTSRKTSNAERNTDVEMDEGRTVDIVNEDSEPSTVVAASLDPVLPTQFEGDIAKLITRLLAKGANKQVVELCNTVFKNGITIEALEERMTREQCEGLGVRDGKQFRLFLQLVVGANGQMTGRHRCCLCSPGKEYKNHRDALRHLLKDHFGLSFRCGRW
jgi:hypothetical protein